MPAAGCCHLTFDPAGRHAMMINELLNSVTMFQFLPESGFLIEQQTISTLPVDFKGESLLC
jgi:6-phosphogluconolactonase (cycloisomerase 2 family)